jgi:gliding motility-associated-like protein
MVTGNAASFAWTPSTYLNNTAIQNPVASPQSDIRYSLTVFDTNGCSTKNTFSISIYGKLYMPSAFTPNGDGINDVFQLPPSYRSVKVESFCVFNRYGQMVFSTRDVGKGWDGCIHSRPQSTGTYVWYIKYEDPIVGKPVIQKGTVVLIR